MNHLPARHSTAEYRSIAEQQFVKELEARARQEELDTFYRERWMARRPSVLAAHRRDRKVLAWMLAIAFTVCVSISAVLAYLLFMSGLALYLAVIFGVCCLIPSGGGCCLVTVKVVHRR